jgi:hypothetical protein
LKTPFSKRIPKPAKQVVPPRRGGSQAAPRAKNAFSNHWKLFQWLEKPVPKSFQPLENRSLVFPIIGKIPTPFSNRWKLLKIISTLTLLLLITPASAKKIQLAPADTPAGYIAHLLVNETPFPGESGWVSQADSQAAMLSILWVLDSRINYVPPGYSQQQIAAINTTNILDVITAGGEKGQCDGFYRDTSGNYTFVPRVQQRIDYLTRIANQGTPGRFATLLQYAQGLAGAYYHGGLREADRFARLTLINRIRVTGRAYSWMTGSDCYHPGGTFIKIPDSDQGLLGGNRFFTLQQKDNQP